VLVVLRHPVVCRVVEGGLKVNGRTAIGESLRREFGFGDIATGTPTAPDVGAMAPWNTATPGSFYSTGEYASQGPQESIPLRTLQTGDVPQTGQQTRPSFLRSFLMNLPTATAGSFQPGGQGGVGGAFRSLQARDRFNEQMGLEQQDRQLRLGQMQRQGVMDESTIRYRNAQIENMNRPPKVSLQHVELASPDDPTQGVPGTFEPASGKYRDAARKGLPRKTLRNKSNRKSTMNCLSLIRTKGLLRVYRTDFGPWIPSARRG